MGSPLPRESSSLCPLPSRSHRMAFWGGLAIALALAANHAYYLSVIGNDVVRADYWRFIPLLEAYYQGTLTLEAMLRATNGPFYSLFVPSVILLDGILLDLPLASIHLMAVVCNAIAVAVVLRVVWRELHDRGSTAAILLIPLAIVLASPVLHFLLAYGQASFSVIRVAFYLLVFVTLSRVLGGRAVGWRGSLLWATLMFFSVAVIGGGYMPGLVVSTLFVTGFRVWAPRRDGRDASGAGWWPWVVIWTLVSAGVASLVLLVPRNPSLVSVLHSEERPTALLAFATRLFANSMIGGKTLLENEAVLWTAGSVGAALCLGGLVFSVRRRRTGVPELLSLGLMAYSLATVASISLARVSYGPNAAFGLRYLADTTLWQAGVLILVYRMTAEVRRHDHRGATAKRIAGILVLLSISLVHLGSLHQQWRRAPTVRRHMSAVKAAVLQHESLSDDELGKRLATNRRQFRYAKEGIEILERYRLNVFREGVDSVRPEQDGEGSTN